MEVSAKEYLPWVVLVAPVEIFKVGWGWKFAISPGIIEICAFISAATTSIGLRLSRGARVTKPNPIFWFTNEETPDTSTKFLISGVR